MRHVYIRCNVTVAHVTDMMHITYDVSVYYHVSVLMCEYYYDTVHVSVLEIYISMSVYVVTNAYESIHAVHSVLWDGTYVAACTICIPSPNIYPLPLICVHLVITITCNSRKHQSLNKSYYQMVLMYLYTCPLWRGECAHHTDDMYARDDTCIPHIHQCAWWFKDMCIHDEWRVYRNVHLHVYIYVCYTCTACTGNMHMVHLPIQLICMTICDAVYDRHMCWCIYIYMYTLNTYMLPISMCINTSPSWLRPDSALGESRHRRHDVDEVSTVWCIICL